MKKLSAFIAGFQFLAATYFICSGTYNYLEYGMSWVAGTALLIGYGFAVLFVVSLYDDMKFISHTKDK